MGKVLNPVADDIADSLDDFRPSSWMNPEDLRRIAGAMTALADTLDPVEAQIAQIGEDSQADDTFGDVELALVAQSLYRLRRRREGYFPEDLFAEPAWDLLLELFVNTVGGKRMSTKSLCAAADVPTSTGLRWLTILETRGLIRRWTPPDDQRVTAVQMTSDCYDGMRKCLSDWLVTSKRDAHKARRPFI